MKYTFVCKDCDRYFEIDLTVSVYMLKSETGFMCPACQSVNTRRTYQPHTIVYNGSGFTKQTKEEIKEDE